MNSESVAAAAGEKGSIRVTAPGLTSHLSKLTSSRPVGGVGRRRPGTMAAGPETCAGYFWRRNFRPETAGVSPRRLATAGGRKKTSGPERLPTRSPFVGNARARATRPVPVPVAAAASSAAPATRPRPLSDGGSDGDF